MAEPAISFGDTVRVRASEETIKLELAGREGGVTGVTMPSVTGLPVIGSLASDYALAVHFEDGREVVWFAPELLEFVDHGAGNTIMLDGVDVKIIRNPDGSWREEPFDNPRKARKPWWRFW